MKQYEKPHFIIKKNLQKSEQTGILFSDQLSDEVLKEVCLKITDEQDFSVEYVDNDYEDEFVSKSYNKGRMAILLYKDEANFISFSEKEINGRNSGVQSVPTAFNIFYMNPCKKKRLHYYFLNLDGNAETPYFIMMYRLMATIGFNFLNEDSVLKQKIKPFSSLDDILNAKKINSSKNNSNNSSYITKDSANSYEIYGKTYGANKYDTSLVCYAASIMAETTQKITLYEVNEKDLKELPKSSLAVIEKLGNIKVVSTNMFLDKKSFKDSGNLRSPRYVFNLLEHIGAKKCAFCSCDIPELIQGAHVWPVASIKKAALSDDEKFESATDGNNGIWLCENHHKLFDENLILINNKGNVEIKCSIEESSKKFIEKITENKTLPIVYKSAQFLNYLKKRNASLIALIV